ncbi:hypothetical protein BC829DRAFT_137610 [Chytridium lagenaria]|nr:hypothetical protein BC829DRAFT_137610 [Chytridium lagenaria]
MPSTTSFIGGRSRNGHSASTGSIHGMGGYAEIEATFPSKLLFSEEVKQHGRGVRDLNEQMAALNFNGEYHPAFGRPVTTNQRQMSADAVYFQPRLPPMLPPPLSYSQRHDVHDNHINVDAYQPRFPSSGPDANLPIVREIQTSKLRVDESKLTRDYFESLTREGREIVMEVETGEEERRMREGVFEVVQEIARRVFPDAILHHFGSTANGFSLANSDMDLCICLRNLESQKISPAQCVEKIGHALKQAGMKDVKMLTRARVPIVKMRDPVTYVNII